MVYAILALRENGGEVSCVTLQTASQSLSPVRPSTDLIRASLVSERVLRAEQGHPEKIWAACGRLRWRCPGEYLHGSDTGIPRSDNSAYIPSEKPLLADDAVDTDVWQHFEQRGMRKSGRAGSPFYRWDRKCRSANLLSLPARWTVAEKRFGLDRCLVCRFTRRSS